MTTKTRNWLLMLCIVVLPFLTFAGFIVSDFLTPPPLPPLPNPNGYDDFVKAGKMVVVNLKINTTFYDDMNETQLQEVVSTNVAALALARAGLSNQCAVPVQYSEIWSNHLSDLASLKFLAQAFLAEGKLAEMENRPNVAAKSYLDVIHLGNESARGGVLIDQLVGIAIEATGTSHLTNLLTRLDAKSCRECAATLENLDSQRQTLDEVMQQENDWSRRTFPGVRNEIARLKTRKSLQAGQAATARKFMQQQVRTRQLIIDLAARAYELDKGKPSASLADLVPDYLKAVPQDSFTGTNMVYSPR